jgi:arabinogalactan endo-1,4-beta-galactosidase
METFGKLNFAAALFDRRPPVLLFFLILLSAASSPASGNFVAGTDLSLLAFFETNGVTYKTNNQTGDAINILNGEAINCVRLRLFTSSAAQALADPYDYINNLTYTVPLAVRVKNAGLQFLLDFHYSDTWADPGHQATPSAWTNLNFTQLVQQMHDYNSNCIAAFKAAGAMPDYVQVGNEITAGILWPNGYISGSSNTAWANFGQLLKAAIQGIRDAAGTSMPKIVVHIDRGGDWATTEWFFDNLNDQSVPFDIIGESYYPFFHGPLANLDNCLTNAAQRYGKPIFIAETAFPWTNTVWSTNIVGCTPSATGQVQYVVALTQIVKSVTNQLGAGIFWWGTEYQHLNGVNLAGYDTTSFFNRSGNVLPTANTWGQSAAPILLNASFGGPNLYLQWPLSGAGMTLTMTTNIAPAAGWIAVTNSVQNTGAVFSTTLQPVSSPSRFYRLRSN